MVQMELDGIRCRGGILRRTLSRPKAFAVLDHCYNFLASVAAYNIEALSRFLEALGT